MEILIVGGGEVGRYLANSLTEEGHDITLIESDEHVASKLDESLDARVIHGNGASAKLLKDLHVDKVDFFLAMTRSDTANIFACSIAKSLGVECTIARIHHQTYSDQETFNYQVHFGVDHMINPEALCAIELARAIRNPSRIAVESFARGLIEVQQVRVSPRSKYAGKRLKDVNLTEGVRVGTVSINSFLCVASAETMLEAGAEITLVGPADVLFKEREKFQPEDRDEGRVSICLAGGTETAVVLGRMLAQNNRFKVRIIEPDGDLALRLAEEFPRITIINGDPTSRRLLEEENVGASDYFIACTLDDENNIMTCLQAKDLGTAHLQLVINKADYESVLSEVEQAMGIELAVSPKKAAVRELMRHLSKDVCVELASLSDGAIRIVEIVVSADCKYTQKAFKEIAWPAGSVVIGLQHRFRAKVPGAMDQVLPGDRIVAICTEEHVVKLQKMFC